MTTAPHRSIGVPPPLATLSVRSSASRPAGSPAAPRIGPRLHLDDRNAPVSTFLLLVLVLVLAAAGGFLGTLLEVAGWIVLGLVVIGALVGFGLWRWARSLLPDR